MNRLPVFSAVLFSFQFGAAPPASSGSVLILQFHNSSQYPDLNWVGESVSERLADEFSAQNQIVFAREARAEALRRLALRPGADFTKATLIRLGKSLDADYICYGTYDAMVPAGGSELKNSSIQVSAHFIDLKKLHDGPDLAEAGRLVDLTRLEEHLAWQSLRFLNPSLEVPLDRFLAPAKLTRVDAEESYVRGLLSPNQDQQQKWFAQALALDPQFSNPAYELGRLSLERKQFRQALTWLQRIGSADFRYPEARFKMGLAAYAAGDYYLASSYFRELAKNFPLNEVYNNLAAAEDRLNQPTATDDFRRALDGDPNNPAYVFNLGSVLLKGNHFDEAAKCFETALRLEPDDTDARDLLGRAQRREFNPSPNKAVASYRLQSTFDIATFRQLKAAAQPKGTS